jgi:tRNA (cytidine/uridine-2'-O-)-methyltransferase
MFQVALFEPEIPPNTGNIIRLCANTGVTLNLIEPLGFNLDDRSLKRAGLDYHEYANLQLHRDYATFAQTIGDRRIFGLSTHGGESVFATQFKPGDVFLFGPETRGLPATLRDSLPPDRRLRIPMIATSRSLNLSNAVAVVVFEAWRQCGFTGGH